MELDWLIFPSPDTSYTYDKSNGELIFIPKNQEFINNEINPNGDQNNIQNLDLNNENSSKKIIKNNN